ncbi:DUF4259 domain-containing protein [Paenibacillus antri]|uniref:DUF4259 domain-containing protein n=1 Tax=Paenibacillus antri TaxID=2582848 RepID=A0A5R9FXR4_9BACL|nr:DUF4259 domain-containing protein [Paenibacillus antri]TLS48842.1 DUF4259 domain-containing protein [Paenibacillus antri]
MSQLAGVWASNHRLAVGRFVIRRGRVVIGAWGYGIFENDDALDIRDRFRRHSREGLPMEEVTKRCMEDFPDPMNDVSVVLALAALQMEQNKLQPEIKRRALVMIAERKEIGSWVNPDKRIRELEVFKQKLLRF